jgi:hypothetical protein
MDIDHLILEAEYNGQNQGNYDLMSSKLIPGTWQTDITLAV